MSRTGQTGRTSRTGQRKPAGLGPTDGQVGVDSKEKALLCGTAPFGIWIFYFLLFAVG